LCGRGLERLQLMRKDIRTAQRRRFRRLWPARSRVDLLPGSCSSGSV
jgi:hypothetical protein